MAGFPSSAELREQAAVAAAEAMKPLTPLFVCAAIAALIASGGMLWSALTTIEGCLALAAGA